jgi:hypothetical protein
MTNKELNRRGPEMFESETPDQVVLHIQTDLGYTADFLRYLANAIENSETDIRDFETFRGVAQIEWPD